MNPDFEGKSLVELLDMLKPAPVPDPISMTPQTWGWVVVAIAFLTVVATGLYLYLRHRRANAYRRAALAEIEHAGGDAAKIAEVLRRTALAAYPRTQVAGLFGKEWLSFLQQTSGIVTFSEPSAQSLINAPYRETPQNPDVTKLVQDWIRSHKSEGKR